MIVLDINLKIRMTGLFLNIPVSRTHRFWACWIFRHHAMTDVIFDSEILRRNDFGEFVKLDEL